MLKILRKTAEHVKTFSRSFCFNFYFLFISYYLFDPLCELFAEVLVIDCISKMGTNSEASVGQQGATAWL